MCISILLLLSPSGIVVIAVNMDDDAAVIPAFLKKHPIDYPVAKGADDLNDKFQMAGYPTTVIF